MACCCRGKNKILPQIIEVKPKPNKIPKEKKTADTKNLQEICHIINQKLYGENDAISDLEDFFVKIYNDVMDAMCFQTELVYILIGHYYDISMETKSQTVELKHFFRWSLLAEGAKIDETSNESALSTGQGNHKNGQMSPNKSRTNKTQGNTTQSKSSLKSTLPPRNSQTSVKEEDFKISIGIWKKMKKEEQVFEALFAAALLKAMSKESVDEKDDLLQLSRKFNQLAIEKIKVDYKKDEKATRRKLAGLEGDTPNESKKTTPLTSRKQTTLEFAVKSKNLEFLKEPVCTSLLDEIWMGHISGTTTIKWLLICWMFLPIIGPMFGVRYRPTFEDKNTKEWQYTTGKWDKFKYFFRAPVIRFIMNGIVYVTVLGYFSYVLLVQFSSEITRDDIILLILVGLIFIEEFLPMVAELIKPECEESTHVIRRLKLRLYVNLREFKSVLSTPRAVWFIISLVSTILFVIGYILKVMDFLEHARIVMGFDLILLYIRCLQILSIHKRLGPKFKDLFYFVLILMVFVVSYGMAAHSIMYPNSELSLQFALNLLKRAYWNLYGELLIEELEQKEPDCTFDERLYSNDVLPRCPTASSTVWIPIMMGLYILVSNILLLNLLIAMFSSTYDRIEKTSSLLWNYQRYYLIKRYKSRTWLPLVSIVDFYKIIKHFCSHVRRLCIKQSTRVNFNEKK